MPAWSYSGLTSFETCPRKHWLTKVAKRVVEPETEATRWGTEMHKHLELRVTDKTPLPEFLGRWEPMMAKITSSPKVYAEQKFGLTRNLTPTGFFDKDCWYRGVIDLVVDGRTATVLDWKTGKVKEDHDQLKLFAATWFASKDYVEKCRTGYVWLKFDKVTRKDFVRDDVAPIWQEFMPRLQRMENAFDKDKWPPKPSGLCNGWCPAGRENCEFWAPRKS